MPELTLVTDEAERAGPSAADVEAALARLESEREAYALLGSGAAEFVQATKTEGRVVLERQAGGARWQWAAASVPLEETRGVFLGYLKGEEAWKSDERWRLFTDEDAAREVRSALLARLQAAPLFVPVSPDGSLWASSDGERTAVLAFAGEAALREACPQAGVASPDLPELLRLFLATPHDTLFIESAGDWLSVSRDEAGALLAAAGR
ncbi:MAG: hypothetical protein KGL53_01635 [Elusimicrobia bacterium]|nr:hypothetical protein [Elusimicrobiota bacterium]